jgi:XrtJ-associated TM-motif-TM protein
MKKTLFLLMVFAVMATAAHAQSGCGDSPENPTAVLGLMGSVGAGIAVLWERFRARK